MSNYGYIGFSFSKNSWSAKLIAWATKSKWSHSFITLPAILGKEMVLEAGEGGVKTIQFDIGYRNNPHQIYEIYEVLEPEEDTNAGVLACMEELQSGYGYSHYPWFIYRIINKWFGKDIKSQDNWVNNDAEEVCSDIIRLRIERGKYKDLFKDFGLDSANAQDGYELVLKNPDKFRLVEKKDG